LRRGQRPLVRSQRLLVRGRQPPGESPTGTYDP
jgi:hypothetical protein